MKGKIIAVIVAILSLSVANTKALSAQETSATDVIKKSLNAFYYQGSDMKVRVNMKLINRQGKERIREFVMLRQNEQLGGNQKYFIYFFRPADVERTTFMIWKYPEKDDDRWLFIPAINLVRRIAANDKRSSFVGSDFTYEDVSGRDVESDTHSLVREEQVNGRDCFILESLPREEAEYAKKVSWIDKQNFLPLKEEYYDIQKDLYKVYASDEVKEIDGFPTVVRRTMRNVKTGHRTEVVFDTVQYGVGIGDSLFSERYLKSPPRKWIR